MDEYEREFGDLLYLRSKPTVYERFYNDNIKNMVTKYNFLPAELIECRMQSLWKKLLAKKSCFKDDTDHSSVHGSLPPLLSRREAEFFAFDDDEDRGHVTDGDYEV